MIDTLIIGGGPAGLSAAINIAARNKKPVVLTRDPSTSWLYKAEKVENHLGQPGMTGREMIESYYKHARSSAVEIRTGRVLQALSLGAHFSVQFDQEILEARTLILATGTARGRTLPGEDSLVGHGVSYCATCDGMLYRGRTAVVVAETLEGEEDALFLSEICAHVYYLPQYDAEIESSEKLTVLKEKPLEVLGDDVVTGIKFDSRTLPCDGVFFIRESVPPASLIPGLELSNRAVQVNRFMETNIPGLFACGDCTGPPLQVSKAIGEGLIAAQQAVKYMK